MNFELRNLAEDSWLTKIDYYAPSAWFGHAPFLRFLIRESKPKIFVELGTHSGFSYFVACQSIKELGIKAQSFAVDHWKGDSHAGEIDESVFHRVNNYNKNFDTFSTIFRMKFSEALNSFRNQTIDILHIDGFHTYAAAKEDFETWLPKMKSDGMILLHDIHVRRSNFGVYELWNELKSSYNTIEFLHSHGLGVVLLGETKSYGNFHGLLSGEYGNIQDMQGVFGSLGDISTQQYTNYKVQGNQDSILADRRAIANLEARICELDKEIELILSSRSWKFTSSLRYLMKLFKRLG